MDIYSPKMSEETTIGAIITHHPLLFIHGNETDGFEIDPVLDCSDGQACLERNSNLAKHDDEAKAIPRNDAECAVSKEHQSGTNECQVQPLVPNYAKVDAEEASNAAPTNFIRCYSLPSSHEVNWPVSPDGEVRIFAPLKSGKNLVLLSSSVTKEVIKDIHVVYEPIQNKRYQQILGESVVLLQHFATLA